MSYEELIRDLAALAEVDARNSRIQLAIDVAEGLPKIMVDAVQIQQVILNLVRNGIDAMMDIGDIDDGISISVARFDDERIRIAVTDHDSGITGEAAKKIFQPFSPPSPPAWVSHLQSVCL